LEERYYATGRRKTAVARIWITQGSGNGLARALLVANEEYRKPLRSKGYLTRDSRMVERKKYGQPGARKRFQFSKR